MRRSLFAGLVALSVAGACGRIGYTPWPSGEGGAGPIGMGGTGPSGTAGAIGSGGSGRSSGSGGSTGSGGSSGSGGAGTAGSGGTGGASCPMGTFGGHDYAFCVGPLSWADAGNDCAAKGMRLVRIDDAAENDWVTMTAFAGIMSTSSIYWSWIGATDQAVAGEWRWTDGALFWLGSSNGSAQGGLYQNWAAGSPSSTGMATDCGILQHATFWTDFDCTRLERYVCERY